MSDYDRNKTDLAWVSVTEILDEWFGAEGGSGGRVSEIGERIHAQVDARERSRRRMQTSKLRSVRNG